MGACVLQTHASLFDDIDMTLGTPKVTTEAPKSPGESLFGGAKMSLSTKELPGGLGGVEGLGGASSIPVSGVYSLPKPQKKVASAMVSTSFTGSGSRSLFDELPNAGASLPNAPTLTSRYFTSPAAPRQTPATSSTGSLFEVEGLVLPLSLPDPIPKSQSVASGSMSVPRPQGPPRPAPKKMHSQVGTCVGFN